PDVGRRQFAEPGVPSAARDEREATDRRGRVSSRADKARVLVVSDRKTADEELVDEHSMDGPLVVLSVGRTHEEVAGGNARQIRRRRGGHDGIGGRDPSGPGCVHESPRSQYSQSPQSPFREKKRWSVSAVRLEQFAMERMQSTYENHVAFNLSESGVHPLRLGELVEDAESREALLAEALFSPQSNGTTALRARIAALYPGATPDHIQVTNGGSE